MKEIKGTGVALITPFNSDFSIDYLSLERIINHVIDGGVDYLVLLGTTAESPALSFEEKSNIVSFAREINKDRVPLVIGIGGNNTTKVVKEILSTDLTGIEAILSVSPYYNKPTQEGIYLHYKLISESSSLPIILYNVPSRTGSNINSQTTLRLARDFNNIVAIKEASGNIKQIQEILDNKSSQFLVLSGDDDLTSKMIQMGAHGVISVVGQLDPEKFSKMVSFGLKKEFASADEIHSFLRPIYEPLYIDGNPAGIKASLSLLGLCDNILRPPLVPVSNTTLNQLSNYLKT